MRYIGIGLYPLAALINHSCVPNSIIVFNGKRAHIRTIREIKSGEEITISYVEIAESRERRQQELASTFFFECTCERCKNPTNLIDLMLAGYSCGSKSCYPLSNSEGDILQCKKCGNFRKRDELQKLEIQGRIFFQEGEKEFKNANFQLARQAYSKSYDIWMNSLYPHNANLLRVKNALLNSSIQLGDWETARKHSEDLLESYKIIYPSYWPNLGLQYFMTGKIESYLQHTTQALNFLTEGATNLLISHGPDSPLVKDLMFFINEVQKEQNQRNK